MPTFVALEYGPTSAPAIWGTTRSIIGVSCGEGPGKSAPGDIRAFDVRKGGEVLAVQARCPAPAQFGHETWAGDSWKGRGGANAWGGLQRRRGTRGLIFAGLGSAALRLLRRRPPRRQPLRQLHDRPRRTDGQARAWHFQTLRHDLWDHDLPCLSRSSSAVTHAGKTDRRRGPGDEDGLCLPLRSRDREVPSSPSRTGPSPASDVPGEKASPTQPIPVKPPPFAAQSLDESNLTDIGEANHASALARLREIRGGPAFNPPSLKGTVVIPGFHGGANWSGASFDPTTGLLYVNSTNLANIITLTAPKPGDPTEYGPYIATGYHPFRDHEGYPAIKPPWGLLNAIDLNTGEFAWRVPLGEHPELTARGIPRTGTESFGGSIATAGGLVFIAGTMDERLHAFDKRTGELLWEHPLPAGGYATPSTYMVGGRQYVVIAAGGAGKLRTRAGDAFVAFRLREGE